MRYFYSLKIDSDNQNSLNISKILEVDHSIVNKNYWEIELVEEASDPHIDFINQFLDLLEGKYEALESLGIQRSDISIWMLYEYDNQCNMEFSSESMKRLGENGINLCVSCWDSGLEEGKDT